MAVFTLTDAFLQINGVTLSDHGNSVTVTDTRDVKDFTAFGATSKVVGKGLGDAKISCTFFQDFAAGKIHQTLKSLISSSTPFTVEVRPTSAGRSATNPAAVMSALLFTYNFVDGGVGEPSMTTAEFQNASQSGLTYPEA